jgi:hypothetical protein
MTHDPMHSHESSISDARVVRKDTNSNFERISFECSATSFIVTVIMHAIMRRRLQMRHPKRIHDASRPLSIIISIDCIHLFIHPSTIASIILIMKVSSAALILLPVTVNGFQVGLPSARSVGPLFSMEPGMSTYEYTDAALPNIAPDIAPDIMPMDLVYEEPVLAPQVSDNEVGKIAINEQTRFSAELLGMDKGYSAETEARFAPPHPPPGEVMRKYKAIKCYQTSKGIYKQAKAYYPPKTWEECLNPKTFVLG